MQDEVTAAFESRGRHYANDRLWQRLDGKVTLEEFIAALNDIELHELANKIEGIILLHRESKKQDTLLMSITLQNINQFVMSLKCGGICNHHFVANFVLSLTVKEF